MKSLSKEIYNLDDIFDKVGYINYLINASPEFAIEVVQKFLTLDSNQNILI